MIFLRWKNIDRIRSETWVIENETPLTCPKCGTPRLNHAWDCVRCGVVFDGRAGEEAAAGDAPSPGAASVAPRTLSSSRIAKASPPPRSLRGWIDDNLAVAVFGAIVLFAAILWVFGRFAVSVTTTPRAVEQAYRHVVGRYPPKGFEAGYAGHFVGRRVVGLEHRDELGLFVYFHRWPARPLDVSELDAGAEKILDFFEIDWSEVRRGTVEQGDEQLTGRILLLGGAQGNHLYLIPIHTADGESAMLALIGPQVKARAFAREIIDRL